MGKSKNPEGVGAGLRSLRKTANMTLDEVAVAAGVSVNYLSRAENDRVAPTSTWVHCVVAAIGKHISDAA